MFFIKNCVEYLIGCVRVLRTARKQKIRHEFMKKVLIFECKKSIQKNYEYNNPLANKEIADCLKVLKTL